MGDGGLHSGRKDLLVGAGINGIPLGTTVVSMVGTRDIAEAAASELLRRNRAVGHPPSETYDMVRPDPLTDLPSPASGPKRRAAWCTTAAATWTCRSSACAPAWLAYDPKVMMRRYQQNGAVADAAEGERFAGLLARP